MNITKRFYVLYFQDLKPKYWNQLKLVNYEKKFYSSGKFIFE